MGTPLKNLSKGLPAISAPCRSRLGYGRDYRLRTDAMQKAVSDFLAELRRANASEHTIRNYESDLGQFVEYLQPPGAELPEPSAIDVFIFANGWEVSTGSV